MSWKVQRAPDLLILVLGSSGVGKSTLVNNLLDRDVMKAGDNDLLGSITQTVEAAAVDESSELHQFAKKTGCGRVVVVDTPGFDNSERELRDMDVLKLIADWLVQAYARRDLLGVLVYVHDIQEDRFSAYTAKNLLLFKNLIGDFSFSNVVIGTTKHVRLALTPDLASFRSAQLQASHWKFLVEGGAIVACVDSPSSVQPIMQCMRKSTFRPILLQVELAIQQKELPATTVGRALQRHILEGLSAVYDGHSEMDHSIRQVVENMLRTLDVEDEKAKRDKVPLKKIDELSRRPSLTDLRLS